MRAAEANLARTRARSVRGEFASADSYSRPAGAGRGGAGPGAKRLSAPPGGARPRRGVGRRAWPCPRRGAGGAGRGQFRARRPGPGAVAALRAPISRTIPMCCRPRRSCAPPPSMLAHMKHRGAGGRRDRPAHRAGGPAGRCGHAADGGGAAVGCLGGRQFQGSAAGAHARRPAGDGHRRYLWRQASSITAMSQGWARARAAPLPAAAAECQSGNWIKIVQRVPVRIALDPAGTERPSPARGPAASTPMSM